MSVFQAIVLGIVQGATEFIPVSSSGHLVLVPWLLGWEPPGLVFDTVVHWGTLLAVLAFFWRDWSTLIRAWLVGAVRRDWSQPSARMLWLIAAGTLPAAAIGFALEGFFESLFGKPGWVSFFLLVTALILVVSERLGSRSRKLGELGLGDALAIGLGQAAAIAPGISRSGSTIAVGLIRGLRRADAARFSFLLATPIIVGAGLFKLLDLASAPDPNTTLATIVAGFVSAAVCGYACIGALLRYLQRHSLYVFAAYCALVGCFCLAVYWLR
jgi:undecaprenyl-diphosphatase